jgi:hypothetical protein
MTVQTYDPKEVAVIVNGQLLTGFSEEIVRAERDNPQVDSLSGAQGDVARVITNDKRGTITVSLLPTSPSNLILSNLANSDGVDGANTVFSFMIRDNRGDDLIQAEDAWVSQPPTVTYNKRIEAREWTFAAAKLEMFIGGIPIAA